MNKYISIFIIWALTVGQLPMTKCVDHGCCGVQSPVGVSFAQGSQTCTEGPCFTSEPSIHKKLISYPKVEWNIKSISLTSNLVYFQPKVVYLSFEPSLHFSSRDNPLYLQHRSLLI